MTSSEAPYTEELMKLQIMIDKKIEKIFFIVYILFYLEWKIRDSINQKLRMSIY
jgi:hypothetical protein